ncbi:competence/damage-inducible protein A [Thermicanus aegyptius]|uniref:competence/damage-inducible protein A n=1 Tax=Thermicanus aegyptius TaxID=94009 RepID=UPI000346977B|nr:competence/damage-inducible protein A [Thermicanus aegyptius]
MRAEILAVGTELLMGQIANTNAQYLSERLAELGINVYYHGVVGDNLDRIVAYLEQAKKRSDIVLITGGLGPTEDDLTKNALAHFLKKNLVVDEEILKAIEEYFHRRKLRMTPNNRRQAEILEGAVVFPNKTGLAAGMGIMEGGIHYLLFPGPPSEMIPMFRDYGIPYLRRIHPESSSLYSRVLRFFGIGESALVTELGDLIGGQTDPTLAPYAKEAEVTLRLTTRAKSREEADGRLDPIQQEILKRVGSYYYGEGEDHSIEKVLFQALLDRGATLATAESCTGGRIGELITTLSGASKVYKGGVVAYTNEAKENLLNIPTDLLRTEGAVSAACALEMADQVRRRLKADYGLSVTGVAGPDAQEEKPVGLVYVGFSGEDRRESMEFVFAGSREGIQLRAAKTAMFQLWKRIKER